MFTASAYSGTFFEDSKPVPFTIEAGFSKAFQEAYAGLPDGIFPPQRLKEPFEGILPEQNIAVVLKVRGNSSLQECSFPKLSLKFLERSADFGNLKHLKIGTHCGDEATTGTIGRLRNEEAAVREEVVYRLAKNIGIKIQRTRPALIKYIETGTEPSFGSPAVRKAFLLEDIDDLASELGGVAEKDPATLPGDAASLIDSATLLRIHMFHALVGNWDWSVTGNDGNGSRFWNTEVVRMADGKILPVPKDFDLASFVTGSIRGSMTAKPTCAEYERMMSDDLARHTADFTRPEVNAMSEEFLKAKAALYDLIAQSGINTAGKTIARAHLDAFYKLIKK